MGMIYWRSTWIAAAVALTLSAPASAQNLSLRAPSWAQPLLASDVIPTTGGRASISGEAIVAAVRVTIAPVHGGVARVIRYEAAEEGQSLMLRRFTGHPSTGWWMWGPDTPLVREAPAALRQEMETLIRAAMGVGALTANASTDPCHGEAAFVEMALEGRATSMTRACVAAADPVGRLALRVSEIAGSRTDEELLEAAIEEVMDADRAFAALAQEEGVPAAFAEYAAADAVMLRSEGAPTVGHDAIVARFATWPEGARLEWAPEAGRVSSRGDMAWTWGNAVYTAPDGTRSPGRYVSTWKRDDSGAWRFALDAGVD
jgi:ketosteroid isomerase-like protein